MASSCHKLDRVEDPKAWWRDIVKSWLPRAAMRGEPLLVYAQRRARLQWVVMPPRKGYVVEPTGPPPKVVAPKAPVPKKKVETKLQKEVRKKPAMMWS